jgi:hypothetical protein
MFPDLLFGPQAIWTDIPRPLLSSESTVIGTSDQLQAGVAPLWTHPPPI